MPPRYLLSPMFTVVLFTVFKIWNQQVSNNNVIDKESVVEGKNRHIINRESKK